MQNAAANRRNIWIVRVMDILIDVDLDTASESIRRWALANGEPVAA